MHIRYEVLRNGIWRTRAESTIADVPLERLISELRHYAMSYPHRLYINAELIAEGRGTTIRRYPAAGGASETTPEPMVTIPIALIHALVKADADACRADDYRTGHGDFGNIRAAIGALRQRAVRAVPVQLP